MSLVSGNSFEIVRPVSWKWRQQVQQRPTFRSCKGQNPPCFWLHFFPRALPPAVIYYSLVSSKSSTHYLSDTNRFDVSSKGPSSGITLIPDEGPLLETSIKGKSCIKGKSINQTCRLTGYFSLFSRHGYLIVREYNYIIPGQF